MIYVTYYKLYYTGKLNSDLLSFFLFPVEKVRYIFGSIDKITFL